MNIAIIGAGPAGSYAAYLFSKYGHQVHLYDQKRSTKIGQPVQCTGLLTSEITKFIPLDKTFHLNTFSTIEVNTPQQKLILNKTEYLINRTKFDQHLLHLAKRSGTILHPQHKLIDLKRNTKNKHNLIFKHNNKLIITSPDLIIGADGPLSLIHKYLNPNTKRTLYYGQQALIKGKFNKATYQTFFGKEICPNLFAWLVPESKTRARIGLATLKNPTHYFNNFLQKLNINNNQIIKKQAGLIPLYNPKTTTKKANIFLLGDAAGHVKATTLGGIIPSFHQAHQLLQHIKNNKPIRKKNLDRHLLIRKNLNKFSDKDYNKLIHLLSKPKNKYLLETSSRENPKKLLTKLFLNEPKLLTFAKYLFF